MSSCTDLKIAQRSSEVHKYKFWRGGRVVYCVGLENRRGVKASVGSNPTPSANLNEIGLVG